MLNLLKIKTLGNEYENVRATQTLSLPTDLTIAADQVGSTRFNSILGVVETWNGTDWISASDSAGGVDYDTNF